MIRPEAKDPKPGLVYLMFRPSREAKRNGSAERSWLGVYHGHGKILSRVGEVRRESDV